MRIVKTSMLGIVIIPEYSRNIVETGVNIWHVILLLVGFIQTPPTLIKMLTHIRTRPVRNYNIDRRENTI